MSRIGPEFELASAPTTLETVEFMPCEIGGEATTIVRAASSYRAYAAQFLSATACWDEADEIKYLREGYFGSDDGKVDTGHEWDPPMYCLYDGLIETGRVSGQVLRVDRTGDRALYAKCGGRI